MCVCACMLKKQADICVGRDRHGERIRLSRRLHRAGEGGGGGNVAWEWSGVLRATSPSGVRLK